MIVDAHCHAWRRWPYSTDVPDPAERGSVATLVYEMDRAGVQRALVVCACIGGADPRTANPDNNAYVAAAVAACPDRLACLVDVDSRWSDSYHRPGMVERMEVAVRAAGAVGITHYLAEDDDGWLGTGEAIRVFRRLAELGLVASVHAPPPWLPSIAALVRAVPEARVVLHHQGLVAPGSARFAADLRALTALASAPHVYVKVSGFHYLTQRQWDFPFRDTHMVLHALVDAFGPERLLWGSDFPVARPHLTYRQSIEVVREHAGLSSDAVASILGGTAARMFGWA
ncbi:amidohydrolase family protein [Phytoactinopolyspora halotolerans]|uniref:Amidohydrolase n=1 Tax=Phytoactinopolyspora halotolerans TaxID=1981512 RepID=A0A6L9SHV7_9ACTN|nr:amidohydrolase family protein [Phytoactinopolyspora halotolerans]NEE04713.1 amidohydrolase [Phytoactinopolyspora halotolerans]